MKTRWQARNPFSRSDAGKAYGELCRAYGVLPHELPAQGTPERRFIEREWDERVKEHNKHAKKQTISGGMPGGSGLSRRFT